MIQIKLITEVIFESADETDYAESLVATMDQLRSYAEASILAVYRRKYTGDPAVQGEWVQVEN